MPIHFLTTDDLTPLISSLETAHSGLESVAERVELHDTVIAGVGSDLVGMSEELTRLIARVTALEQPTSPPPPPPPPPPVDPLPPVEDVRLFPATLAAELATDPAPLYARLDDALPLVLTRGSYQGSQLPWVKEYATGYQHAVKAGDIARADKYARKALATALGGVRNYQKGGFDARECIGRGDGTRTRFPLRKTPIVSSVAIFTSPIAVNTVTRGTGVADLVNYYSLYLRVYDASREYARGDWDRAGVGNNLIRWPGTNKPAAGTTYTVDRCGIISPTRVGGWTVQGDEIVFAMAPAVGLAIVAECVFDDLTQTEALDGGYANILVDQGYATRHLGNIAYVLDWCAGHPLVEAARAEITAQLVEWFNAIPARGYNYATIASNFGVGHYSCRALIAVALGDSERLAAVLQYRDSEVVPELSGPAPSLKGGWWPEGWGYGELAATLILDTAKLLTEAGLIGAATETAWADEVRAHLATAFPVGGGDYFAYPPTTANALRAKLAPLPAPQPLHIAEGTGLTVVRGDTLRASLYSGNLLWADHQQCSPGHNELWRGDDPLVITAQNITRNQTPSTKTDESNTLTLNDPRGTAIQQYPFNMGFWYGVPGIVELARQDTADYHFVAFEGKAAFSLKSNPGAGGPCAGWVRYWLAHRRLGFVVTLDRIKTVNADCYRDVRWHLSPGAATQTLNRVTADRGGSRVQVTGLSDGPLDVQLVDLPGKVGVVPQIKLVAPNDRTDVVIVSVVQTGPAGAVLPVPTWIADGCEIGGMRIAFSGNAVGVS